MWPGCWPATQTSPEWLPLCDHCIQPVHGFDCAELQADNASAATTAKRFIVPL
jgi:hypothetical protein